MTAEPGSRSADETKQPLLPSLKHLSQTGVRRISREKSGALCGGGRGPRRHGIWVGVARCGPGAVLLGRKFAVCSSRSGSSAPSSRSRFRAYGQWTVRRRGHARAAQVGGRQGTRRGFSVLVPGRQITLDMLELRQPVRERGHLTLDVTASRRDDGCCGGRSPHSGPDIHDPPRQAITTSSRAWAARSAASTAAGVSPLANRKPR